MMGQQPLVMVARVLHDGAAAVGDGGEGLHGWQQALVMVAMVWWWRRGLHAGAADVAGVGEGFHGGQQPLVMVARVAWWGSRRWWVVMVGMVRQQAGDGGDDGMVG